MVANSVRLALAFTLVASTVACASEDVAPGPPEELGLGTAGAAGAAADEAGGAANPGSPPTGNGGAQTISPSGSGGYRSDSSGGSNASGTTNSGGTSTVGSGGACNIPFLCPVAAGGTTASGGTNGGGAAGALKCDNAACFDIFDCAIFHPDLLNCGFTKCEGFICKK
jgi:hypothetical protein